MPLAGAPSNAGAPSEPAAGPEPWPSGGVLFLVCFLIVAATRIYSLGLWRPALLHHGLFYGGLTSLPIAALCLVPQLLVPRRLKRSGLPRIAAFTLPAVALAAFAVYWGLPSTRVRAMLDGEHLAPLPPSATGVQVQGWVAGFAHRRWLRFTAPAEEVEAFLENSPLVRGTEPEHFGPGRMLLLPPLEGGAVTFWDDDGPTAYAYLGPDPPPWYAPEIREKGRRYACPHQCTVIVNDATGTVYIHTSD
jgi:hypothetical protein